VDAEPSNEDLRLSYRLRRSAAATETRNLRIRHKVTKATRDFLDEKGFVEIETPILSKEHAGKGRAILVPSRIIKGKFYALPQAPPAIQTLLMVGGIEKYFQIANVFGTKTCASDRSRSLPRSTSKYRSSSRTISSRSSKDCSRQFFGRAAGSRSATPFPRMTHAQAMMNSASDKPDRRFAMRLIDLGRSFSR